MSQFTKNPADEADAHRKTNLPEHLATLLNWLMRPIERAVHANRLYGASLSSLSLVCICLSCISSIHRLAPLYKPVVVARTPAVVARTRAEAAHTPAPAH